MEELAPEIGDCPSIIYVDSKKAAIDLTTSFYQHTSIKTAAYTGEDTSRSDKKAVITNWSEEEVTLVVATSAFGLGINKDNVQNIYHIGVPNCLEAWMQQAGRGGRDGNTCTGEILLFPDVTCTHISIVLLVSVLSALHSNPLFQIFQLLYSMTPTTRSSSFISEEKTAP